MDNCQVFSGRKHLFIRPTEGACSLGILKHHTRYRECWDNGWAVLAWCFVAEFVCLIEVTIKALNYTNQHQKSFLESLKMIKIGLLRLLHMQYMLEVAPGGGWWIFTEVPTSVLQEIVAGMAPSIFWRFLVYFKWMKTKMEVTKMIYFKCLHSLKLPEAKPITQCMMSAEVQKSAFLTNAPYRFLLLLNIWAKHALNFTQEEKEVRRRKISLKCQGKWIVPPWQLYFMAICIAMGAQIILEVAVILKGYVISSALRCSARHSSIIWSLACQARWLLAGELRECLRIYQTGRNWSYSLTVLGITLCLDLLRKWNE